MTERTMKTARAVWCGLMCAGGWIWAGIPHTPVDILMCTAGHFLFLTMTVSAWELYERRGRSCKVKQWT